MLRMLIRVTSSAGFEVATFGSAEALLNSGQITEASCVILDIDLPGISGLDLQQKFNQRGRDVPIIVISGQATEITRRRALQQGAFAFLDKPFNLESLLAAIRSAASLTPA